MSGLPRRRHVFVDAQLTADITTKLDTRVSRVFFVVAEMPNVQALQFHALLCFAHHVDMAVLRGEYEATYPADLADIMGCSSTAAARYLYELKGLGLALGSAAGGYTLPARIEGGPLIMGPHRKSA